MAADGQTKKVIDDLEGFSSKLVTRLMLDLRANVIEETPVDTGWARANWLFGVGSQPEDPGSVGGKDREALLARVAGRRAAAAGTEIDVISYSIADGSVWLSNFVPYIVVLNEGHSSQAEPGWVQASIQKAIIENTRRAAT